MIYDISYKTLIGPKPLRIRFHKIDGFIRIFDGARYLVLFYPEKYDAINNRIRCLKSQKSGIAYFFPQITQKCKVGSYDFLPVEKILLTLHNVIILIKSVLNKDQNHYYYKIFLQKCSYQLAKK